MKSLHRDVQLFFMLSHGAWTDYGVDDDAGDANDDESGDDDAAIFYRR